MPELTPEQKAQLDRNIRNMLEGGASEADVIAYTKDFKAKYDVASVEKKNPVGTASSNGSKSGGPSTSTSPLQSSTEKTGFETDPRAFLNQAVAQPQAVAEPEGVDQGLSRSINSLGGRSLAAPPAGLLIDASPNPYTPVLDVINKARPNDPATRASLYDQIVGDYESGDESRGKRAKTELLALSNESNPEVITPADKLELKTLTGVDDPAQQLEVLNARIGKTTQTGDVVGSVLNPLLQVDLGSLPAADSEKLGVYRDKLAYNLNQGNKKNTKWSDQSVLTKGGQQTTELENFLNLTSGVAGITNASVEEAKRYNSEKLTDSFSTGLESIKESDPARYKRNVDAITNGKPLTTTDVVDLTAIGTKIIQRQNSQDIVDRKIDSDQYIAGQEDLAKTQEQNVYGHPDFLRSVVADVIAKHYEKDGTVLFSKWMVTDKEIDAVPDSEYLAQGLDPNNPEFKKQKEFLKQKEGWFPFQNSIAKDDLFREFRKGAAEPFKGIVSTVESIAADVADQEEGLLLDRQTRQTGVGAVANQRGKYFDDNYGKYADAFNGFGQFASQLAIMAAGGAGAAAAGEALGGGTVAARLLGATRMEKLGNLLVDNAQLYGTYGTSFIQSYGDYFKDALSKGADPLQAKMMAFTNASMEGVSETIFDNVRFGKEVAKNLLDKRNYDKIAKVFDRGVWDDLSQKQYREIVSDVASNTWKTFKTVVKAGGAAAKESFEEVPVAMTNFVVDAAANPANVKGRDVLLEAKDAFMNGLVSFSIPSLLGLAGGLRQQFASEKTASESLMIAAMQQPYVTESINRLVQAGTITQEQANQKLKVVNTAAQELQRIPQVYADDKPMTQADREKYLSLSVKEKVLENSLPDNDKAAQKIINGKIADILAQKDEILNKPVAEVVKETATSVTQAAAPTLFERTKSALIAKQESKEDNEGNRFQLESFKNATEEDVMTGAIQQSVDAPESAISQFNGDRELVTDLIAQNDEQTINDSIKKWQDRAKSFVPAGNTEEEQTSSFNEMNKDVKLNLASLREGLAKKQEQAKAPLGRSERRAAAGPSELLTLGGSVQDIANQAMEDKREGKQPELISDDTELSELSRIIGEQLDYAEKRGTDNRTTFGNIVDSISDDYFKKVPEYGKRSAFDITNPMTDENIIKEGETITADHIREMLKAGIEKIEVFKDAASTQPTTKKEPTVSEVEEVKPAVKTEPITAQVSKFEHPFMENPVYKVTVGGQDRFIQRSEGMNPGDTAWYEVKKFGQHWKSPKGNVGIMSDGFLGFTKKEAVDKLVGERETEMESEAPKPSTPPQAEGTSKPKIRVSAEQVQAAQPQSNAKRILGVDDTMDKRIQDIINQAKSFEEFEKMVNADMELSEYLNSQFPALQDMSKLGTLEGEKVGTERGAIGVNKQQLMSLLGATMYDKPLAQVAVKELLQNSFDAVKARQNLTENKDAGNIEISIDRDKRTISIKDDGIGMTPDIVKNAFLSIGGTNKEGLSAGERSGGLGLAKVQFLMGSESVKVVTVRDGIKTTIDATNIQLYNDDFDIKTEETKEPNGSFVEVTIPKNYKTLDGTVKDIHFPGRWRGWGEFDILQKPLIGDANISVNYTNDGETTTETVPIGKNISEERLPPQFTKVKFDWGEADVYMSVEKTNDPNHQILSSGIYQFDYNIRNSDYKTIPYNIVVNIKPSVGSTSEQYPFNNQREGFKRTVENDIGALKAYLLSYARGESEKEAVDVFSDIKPLPQVDPSRILTPAEREKLYADVEKTIEENKQRRISKGDVSVEEAAKNIYINKKGEVRNQVDDTLLATNEKEFQKSFKAEKEIGDVAPVNTEFFNPQFPQYHNNTNVDYINTPGAVEFITDFGNTVLQLVRFAGDNLGYEYSKLRTGAEQKFFAGVSIDKTYGGVHIRKIINAIFVNPLSFDPQNLEEAVGVALHVTLHEINHTTASGEGANFTTDLAKLYGKIYASGKYGLFEGLFRSVYKKHFDTFQTLKNEYDKSTTKNLSRSFEGNEIKEPDKGGLQGDEANVPPGQSTGQGPQGDRPNTPTDRTGDVISSKLSEAGKVIRSDLSSRLKELWDTEVEERGQPKYEKKDAKDLARKIKNNDLNYSDVIAGQSDEFIEALSKEMFGRKGFTKFSIDADGFKNAVQKQKDFGLSKQDVIDSYKTIKKLSQRELGLIDQVFADQGNEESLNEFREAVGALAKGTKPKSVLKRLSVSNVTDMVKALNHALTYEAVSNQQLEDIADYIISVIDIDNAQAYINNMYSNNLSDVKQILRAKLIIELQNAGKDAEATQMVEDMANDATVAGRQTQSLKRAYEILSAQGNSKTKTAFARKYVEAINKRATEMNQRNREIINSQQADIDRLNKEMHEKTQKSSAIQKIKDIINKLCGIRNK